MDTPDWLRVWPSRQQLVPWNPWYELGVYVQQLEFILCIDYAFHPRLFSDCCSFQSFEMFYDHALVRTAVVPVLQQHCAAVSPHHIILV